MIGISETLQGEEIRMNQSKKMSTLVTYIMSGAVLTAVLLFSLAPRLHAEDMDRCQRRIVHAEHELHEARERCWREQHRWWDEHEHRWRTDRDWDEHDHDRD